MRAPFDTTVAIYAKSPGLAPVGPSMYPARIVFQDTVQRVFSYEPDVHFYITMGIACSTPFQPPGGSLLYDPTGYCIWWKFTGETFIADGFYYPVYGQYFSLPGTMHYWRYWIAPVSGLPGMLVNMAGGLSLGKIAGVGTTVVLGQPQLAGAVTLGKISLSAGLSVNNPITLAGGIVLGKIALSGGLSVILPHVDLSGAVHLGHVAVAGALSVGSHVALAGALTIGSVGSAGSLEESGGGGSPWWYFADDTFVAPATANYAILCIGSGGAGGAGFLAAGPSGGAGGGGGGGAFAGDTVSLTAGDSIGITVGTSASPGPAEFGAMVIADYGSPGQDGTAISSGAGGFGGNPVNCTGSTIFAGGLGGNAFSTLGGGGAGSASDSQNGNNGGNATLVGGIGATGVGGSVIGGQGGGDGALATANGIDAPPGTPSSWGGGGGGGGGQANSAGGAAGGGLVLVIQL